MPNQSDALGIQEARSITRSWLGSGSIDFFGKPYAGKDTHAEILASEFNGVVLGAGKTFRADTRLSDEARRFMEAGNIVESGTFFDRMLRQFHDPSLMGRPLLLTAVARMSGEPEPVMQYLRLSHHPVRAVVHIVISDEIARNRLIANLEHGGRDDRKDDTLDALEVRLDAFATQTTSAIEEFRRNLGEIIEIDGDAPREIVTANIRGELAKIATRSTPEAVMGTGINTQTTPRQRLAERD